MIKVDSKLFAAVILAISVVITGMEGSPLSHAEAPAHAKILSLAETPEAGDSTTLSYEILDKELNLGSFHSTTPRYGTIRLRNTGDAPLLIQSVRGNCGCTATDYDRTPIPPDSIGRIHIKFDGEGRLPGRFRKLIKIRTNASRKPGVAFVSGTISG